MSEDYCCQECFECGSECITTNGLLTCEDCGKTYTQQQWDAVQAKNCERYIEFFGYQ